MMLDNLSFMQETLFIRTKTCDDCWHNREGGCLLQSCDCATAVFNKVTDPPHWTSYEEGEKQEARALTVGAAPL